MMTGGLDPIIYHYIFNRQTVPLKGTELTTNVNYHLKVSQAITACIHVYFIYGYRQGRGGGRLSARLGQLVRSPTAEQKVLG